MNQLALVNAILTTAMISMLAACSGGGDSASTTTTQAADTSGQVVNSYISGATVTLDLNDDRICDVGEPQMVTDATGHYSFIGKGAHVVCATGGTNTVTGLPFVGELKAPANATVVTPLTTLIVAESEKDLPPAALGKAAPLNPTAVAAAQTAIMLQLGLPSSSPVLTTDPVALMTKTGASLADAKLEQTNAAVQVLLQQVTQSIIASADLPSVASPKVTNEVFGAAVTGLQTALTAVGGAPVDLTTATTASTGRLINALATKAAATVKASQTLAAVSSSFGTIAPTNVAAAIAATPLADLVNAVATASPASLTTKGGAETTAASATQMATVVQQIAKSLSDSADAGAVSTAVLTNLIKTLLPSTGEAATQAAADAAIANAIATINAALPPGKPHLTIPVVSVQPPVVIPVARK